MRSSIRESASERFLELSNIFQRANFCDRGEPSRNPMEGSKQYHAVTPQLMSAFLTEKKIGDNFYYKNLAPNNSALNLFHSRVPITA